MTALRLALSYLRQRGLGTALNIALLAIGVATITLLVLVNEQVEERLAREAAGFDLVVGAKGSPLQLVLCALFHVDIPNGNVPLAEVRALSANPLVAQVIPLSLGDSVGGFRIVGTEPAYVEHYGGRIAAGRLWSKPLEAVVGSRVAAATGLREGSEFAGSHGLAEGGAEHGDHRYRVTGVLAPTGSVIDRLVLTGLESVWVVHGHGDEDKGGATRGAESTESDHREVTAALIRYRSPLAAASLPRAINAETRLQAASPPLEVARLMAVFGVGVDALRTLAWVLVCGSALGVFVALYQALNQRQYDIAILRTLGASRGHILASMLLESLLLTAAGIILGLAAGHLAVAAIGTWLPEAKQFGLTAWYPATGEVWAVVLVLGSGILAALLPAWRAYRVDVAKTLAKG